MNKKEQLKKELNQKAQVFINDILHSVFGAEEGGLEAYLRDTIEPTADRETKSFVSSRDLRGFATEETGVDMNAVAFGKTMTSLGFFSCDVYLSKKLRRGYYVNIKDNATYLKFKEYEQSKR